MSKYLILLFCLASLPGIAQKSAEVGGMQISWKYIDGYIEFNVSAPNDGWVALGFNQKNDIKDTHLLMFSTDGERQDFQELYVKAAGNPVQVSELFEKTTDIVYSCEEEGKTTQVLFRIALNTYPEYSTSLNKGTEVWLICAFSEDDDFEHHSMMRKHVKVVL